MTENNPLEEKTTNNPGRKQLTYGQQKSAFKLLIS